MCDCEDMFCSGCKPIVTKKEVPSTLIITTYTCPTCKNSSRSQTEIQKCIKSHLPKPEPKYKVGDCVKILHYPGDYGEYDNAIITNITSREDTYFYELDITDEENTESEIVKLIMSVKERLSLLESTENLVKTLPTTVNWEILWSNRRVKYYLKGYPK